MADYGRLPPKLRRITVAGEVPVSVHGEHSVALEGDSAAYVGSRT